MDTSFIEHFYAFIDSLGVLGPLVFILAYVVATVGFIPGSALTIGAGLLFGLWKGVMVVSIASITGACLAFLVARYALRSRVQRRFAKAPRFQAIDQAIAKEGGKMIFLLRLTPLMPFSLSNYLYGLTAVPFTHYFFASWVGMLPGTILYVYIGSLGKLAADASMQGGAQGGRVALQVIAFIATVLVTVFITKVARKALGAAQLQETDTPS